MKVRGTYYRAFGDSGSLYESLEEVDVSILRPDGNITTEQFRRHRQAIRDYAKSRGDFIDPRNIIAYDLGFYTRDWVVE